MMERLLASVRLALAVPFHRFPRAIGAALPHGAKVLSWGILYNFVHTLALLWFFDMSLVASVCTLAVAALGRDGGVASSLQRPLGSLGAVYSLWAVVSISVRFGRSMWKVAWEIYHDFPTMRHMLVGHFTQASAAAASKTDAAASEDSPQNGTGFQRQFSSGTDSDCPSPARTLPRRRTTSVTITPHATRRRSIVMLTPLLLVASANVLLLAAQVYCEPRSCGRLELFEPTSRINRTLRFVLFVAMLQWMQVWTGLFPLWDRVLAKACRHWSIYVVRTALLLLVPTSGCRLLAWLLRPAGSGIVRLTIFGFRNHFADSLLVTGWCFWMIMAAAVMLRQDNLKRAGFSLRRIADDDEWKTLCASFKGTIFGWQLLHMCRGFLKIGFASTVNDMLVINTLYPVLVCFVWTVTFLTVALARYNWGMTKTTAGVFLIGLALAALSNWICVLAGRDQLLLQGMVWLHLGIQTFNLLSSALHDLRVRWSESAQDGQQQTSQKEKVTTFSLNPEKHAGLRATYSSGRKVGRALAHCMVFLAVVFSLFLTLGWLIGRMQHKQGLIGDMAWWKPIPSGAEVTNFHGQSVMTLTRANASTSCDADSSVLPRGETPHYGLCSTHWHGLTLLDYTLLTMLTYINPKVHDLSDLLDTLFLPYRKITLHTTPSTHRKWLEYEVQVCEDSCMQKLEANPNASCHTVTVVAVAGMDPHSATDLVESVRMWVEPVVLQILSVFLPTIRLWPRETSTMVVATVHRALQELALHNDDWHYKEILDRVRAIPKEQEAVITGHSLGGGIALIVGALTQRFAVALHPPGIYHSLAKHQVQQSSAAGGAIHQRSVTLTFEGDWVSHFDSHGGLVQTMHCDLSTLDVQLGCHQIEGAVCHLLRHCGDSANRFASCKHIFSVPTQQLKMEEL